jgi:hypothetical protein
MASESVKILLALPADLKSAIDCAAKELGQTRSAFIRERLARSLDCCDRREREQMARLKRSGKH